MPEEDTVAGKWYYYWKISLEITFLIMKKIVLRELVLQGFKMSSKGWNSLYLTVYELFVLASHSESCSIICKTSVPVSYQFPFTRKFNLQLQRKPWSACHKFYNFYIKDIQASDLYYNYNCIIYIFHHFKISCMSLERSFWRFLNNQVLNCRFPLEIKT